MLKRIYHKGNKEKQGTQGFVKYNLLCSRGITTMETKKKQGTQGFINYNLLCSRGFTTKETKKNKEHKD